MLVRVAQQTPLVAILGSMAVARLVRPPVRQVAAHRRVHLAVQVAALVVSVRVAMCCLLVARAVRVRPSKVMLALVVVVQLVQRGTVPLALPRLPLVQTPMAALAVGVQTMDPVQGLVQE
jgi:hypothetical protein